MAGLKGLKAFQKFDVKSFLAKKQLLLMAMDDWKDYQSSEVIGAKLRTTIWTDDTDYGKAGINNEGIELEVKVRGLKAEPVNRKNRGFIRLRNPRANVYGDFQNQLSIEADGFDYVEEKRDGNK